MPGTILLDTNVLSEMMRVAPEPRVFAFIEASADVLVASVTFHELQFGAERLAAGAKKAAIVDRIDLLRDRFKRRIVDIDLEIAELSGKLRAGAVARGFNVAPMDTLIAASAIVRGANVATRNIKDFEPLGVGIVNPWRI